MLSPEAIGCGKTPRVARDHVHDAPAELLGANDAEATVEQAVAKEAVLLVLRVGLDGTGLQVEVEDYALPPRDSMRRQKGRRVHSGMTITASASPRST